MVSLEMLHRVRDRVHSLLIKKKLETDICSDNKETGHRKKKMVMDREMEQG